MAKAKFYEFTVSGSYLNSQKEIFDYDKLKVLVPFHPVEEIAVMHLMARYVPEAIRADERYQEHRFHRLRQTHVDDQKLVDGELSYVGKDIKELDDKELQDLATAQDLRYIPLPKRQSGMAIRDMRVRAYMAYTEKVLMKALTKEQREEIETKFAQQPSIILTAGTRADSADKLTNEEIIEQEQNTKSTEDDPAKRFTLAELMTLADQKKIPYDKNSDKDKLFKYLYGKLYS